MALTVHSHTKLAKTCLLCGSSKSSSNISMKHHVKWTDALCKLYRIDIHIDPDDTKKGRTENQISDLVEVCKIVKLAFYCFKCYKQLEFVYQLYHSAETDEDGDGDGDCDHDHDRDRGGDDRNSSGSTIAGRTRNQEQDGSERSKKTKLRLLRGFQKECELKLQNSIETLILVRKKNLNIFSDINVEEAELHKYNDAYEKEIIKRQRLLSCMLLEARDSADVKPVLIPQFIPSSVLYRSDPLRKPSSPSPAPVKDCSGSTPPLPVLAPAPVLSSYPPPPPLLYFPPKQIEESLIQVSHAITKEIEVIEINSDDGSVFESDSDSNWEDIEDHTEESSVQSKLVSEFKIHQNRVKPKLTPKPTPRKPLRSELESESEPVPSKPQRQDCQSLLNLLKPLILAKKATETISTQTESELLQSQNDNKMAQDNIPEDNNNDTKTQSQNQEIHDSKSKSNPDLSDLTTKIGAIIHQNENDQDAQPKANSILICCENQSESNIITHESEPESTEISRSEIVVVNEKDETPELNEILIQNSTAEKSIQILSGSESRAKTNEISNSETKGDKTSNSEAKIDEISNSKAKFDEISNSEVETDNILNSEAKRDEISNSDAKIDEISNSEAKVDDISTSEANIDEISYSEATIDEISNSEAKIDDILNSEAIIDEISNSEAKIGEISKCEAKIDEILNSEAKTGEISKSKAKIGEISNLEAKISEVSKPKLVVVNENVNLAPQENTVLTQDNTLKNNSEISDGSRSDSDAKIDEISNFEPQSEIRPINYENIVSAVNETLIQNITNENNLKVANISESEVEMGTIPNSPPKSAVEVENPQEIIPQVNGSSQNLIVSPTKVSEVLIQNSQPKSAVEINTDEDKNRNAIVNNVVSKNHWNEIESNITDGFEAEFTSVPPPQLAPQSEAQLSSPNKSGNSTSVTLEKSSVLSQSSTLVGAGAGAGAGVGAGAAKPQNSEMDRENRYSSLFKCIAEKLSKTRRLWTSKTHQNSGGTTFTTAGAGTIPSTGAVKTELKSRLLKNQNQNQYSNLKLRYNLKEMFVVLDRITIIEAPKTDPAPPPPSAPHDLILQKRTRSGRTIQKPFKLKEQKNKITIIPEIPKIKSKQKCVSFKLPPKCIQLQKNTAEDFSLIPTIKIQKRQQRRKRNGQIVEPNISKKPEENPVPVPVLVPFETVEPTVEKVAAPLAPAPAPVPARAKQKRRMRSGSGSKRLVKRRKKLVIHAAEKVDENENWSETVIMPKLSAIQPLELGNENVDKPSTDTDTDYGEMPFLVPESDHHPFPVPSPSPAKSMSDAGEQSVPAPVQIKTEMSEILETEIPRPSIILRIGRGIRKNSRPRVVFDFNRSRKVQNHVAVGPVPVDDIPNELLFRYPCTWASCTHRYEFGAQLKEHITRFHEGLKHRYRCEKCGRPSSSYRKYLDHQNVHNELKPYECSVPGCGKTFYTAENCARHGRRSKHNDLKIGAGIFPIQKSPGIQMDRKKTMRKKNKTKVKEIDTVKAAPYQMDHIEPVCIGFVCGICKKTYPTKLSLSSHKKFHKLSRPSFPCRTCARVFSSNCLLKLHVARVHSNLYEFKQCQHLNCEFAAPDQSSLEHHTETVHSGSILVPVPVPVSAIKIDPDPIE